MNIQYFAKLNAMIPHACDSGENHLIHNTCCTTHSAYANKMMHRANENIRKILDLLHTCSAEVSANPSSQRRSCWFIAQGGMVVECRRDVCQRISQVTKQMTLTSATTRHEYALPPSSPAPCMRGGGTEEGGVESC